MSFTVTYSATIPTKYLDERGEFAGLVWLMNHLGKKHEVTPLGLTFEAYDEYDEEYYFLPSSPTLDEGGEMSREHFHEAFTRMVKERKVSLTEISLEDHNPDESDDPNEYYARAGWDGDRWRECLEECPTLVLRELLAERLDGTAPLEGISGEDSE